MVSRALRLLCVVAVVVTLALAPTAGRAVFATRSLSVPNCTGTYTISASPVPVGGTAQFQEDSNGNLTGSLNITNPIPSSGTVQGTVASDGSVQGTMTIAALGGNPISVTGSVNADCSSGTLTANVLGINDTITLTRQASPTSTPTSGPTSTPTDTSVPGTPTPTTTPASSASIWASAALTSPFQPITVNGAGFGPTEKVTLRWNTTFSLPVASVTTSGSGTFTVSFLVPSAARGSHSIIAKGMQSGRSTRTAVQIVPIIYLMHATGKAGSVNAIWGFGFQPYERIVATWQSGNHFLGTVRTNSLGGFGLLRGVIFKVPSSASDGQYQISVQGLKSNTVAATSFTVGTAATPTSTPVPPTNTPAPGSTPTNTPPPGSTPTPVAGTSTPTPIGNGPCTGVYSISASPIPITGTANLVENNNNVSGSLNISGPIASTGSVQGTVAPDDSVSGTMTVAALGPTPIPVTGSVNADCSSGTLVASVFGQSDTITLTRIGGAATSTPTPIGGGSSAPTPTLPPITPSPSRNCSGSYTITGNIPGFAPVQGTAQLQDNGGSISGSLHFNSPIPSDGSVSGTVDSNGNVQGSIVINALGSNPIQVTGSVNGDCSSGTLSGNALGITATFTLTRGGSGASGSGSSSSSGGGSGQSSHTSPMSPLPAPIVNPITGLLCPPQGRDLVLNAKVAQRKINANGMLGVAIHSEAQATVNVYVMVVEQQSHYVGKGSHRRKVTQDHLLYHTSAHGTADAHGMVNGRVKVAYNPPHDSQVLVTVVANKGCSVGQAKAKATLLHLIPHFSIATHVNTASSPANAKGASCTATVALAVTVTFGAHKPWSKDAVLVYQPPSGVTVLNAPRGTKPNGPVRFAIPRPKGDTSTVVLKLSTHPSSVHITTAHGWRLGFQVQVAGAVKVLQKKNTLGNVKLNVNLPQLCGGSGKSPSTPTKGGKPAPTPTATPVVSAKPTPPPATSGPNCSGTYNISGKITTNIVGGTVVFKDNNGVVTGSVNITQGPIPSTGSVQGTVTRAGAVQGRMSLDKLPGVPITLTGQVDGTCSSGTLSGTVLNVPSTFTLTRIGF